MVHYYLCPQSSIVLILHTHTHTPPSTMTSQVPTTRSSSSIPLDGSLSNIRELDLTDSGIDDTTLDRLIASLADNAVLQRLKLRRNPSITPRGWATLMPFLQSCTRLTCLDLSRSSIDDDVAIRLAHTLAKNDTLKKLDLSHNERITSNGFVAFGLLFQSPVTILESFHLIGNVVCDDVAVALANSLSDNRSLKKLWLGRSNRITSRGLRAFSFLLQNPNCQLTVLNFSRCHIQDDAAVALAASLVRNTKLKYLNLGDATSVTATGWGAFSHLLCNTTSNSFDGIYDSNHTLGLLGCGVLSKFLPPEASASAAMVEMYLEYNRMGGVRSRQRKILDHYFGGDFSMEPFADMGVQLLVHVLAWISRSGSCSNNTRGGGGERLALKHEKRCQSAMFHFLRSGLYNIMVDKQPKQVATPTDAKTAIADVLLVMMNQERTTYACNDYLNTTKTQTAHQASINTPMITASDRQRVIDWCYDIIDQCHLNREIMAVAMNLADRFMCIPSRQQIELLYHRGQYQLLIVTALYVAVKMNEPIVYSSADFAAVTHDAYTATELEEMEQTLLSTLEWRCCVPTPQQIGMHILELLKLHLLASKVIHPSSPTWNFLEEELAFQTQHALRDYFFANQRSSTVAVISILNAIEQVNDIEYEPLMRTLIVKVLKKFEFEDSSTLLYSRHRLRSLIEDSQAEIEAEGEDDDSNFDTSSRRSCESEGESFVHIETYEGVHCHRQDENGQQQDASSSSQQDCKVSKEASQVVPLKGSDTYEVPSAALTCTSSLGASFESLRVIAIHNDGKYTPVTHTVI